MIKNICPITNRLKSSSLPLRSMILFSLILSLVLSTTSCQEKKPAVSTSAESQTKITTPTPRLPEQRPQQTYNNTPDNLPEQRIDHSPIRVKVNGEAITEADINFSLQQTFSAAEQMLANERLKDKVLQSLIAARAMKHSMQHSLDQEAQSLIQQKTAAYEEALYVKAYLKAHAKPEVVTQEMVNNWYKEHYLLAVNQIETRNVQPLSEVSAQIRKKLAPIQLKKAIKQAIEQAVNNARIDYANDL